MREQIKRAAEIEHIGSAEFICRAVNRLIADVLVSETEARS
jgi:hypothetical protein